MKEIFTGYRILDWQYFSFITWIRLHWFLLASTVSYEKSSYWNSFPFISKVSFLHHCFEEFISLSSIFWRLTIIFMVWISLGLFYLGFTSWIFRFMSFARVGEFQSLFLWQHFDHDNPSRGRGTLPCYCQVKVDIQVFSSTSVNTLGGSLLTTVGWG